MIFELNCSQIVIRLDIYVFLVGYGIMRHLKPTLQCVKQVWLTLEKVGLDVQDGKDLKHKFQGLSGGNLYFPTRAAHDIS